MNYRARAAATAARMATDPATSWLAPEVALVAEGEALPVAVELPLDAPVALAALEDPEAAAEPVG